MPIAVLVIAIALALARQQMTLEDRVTCRQQFEEDASRWRQGALGQDGAPEPRAAERI